MKRFIIIALIFLALVVLYQDFLAHKKEATPVAPRPYVVMLSLDGFRWDYDTKTTTPALDTITKYGVKAYGGLQPCFPSKTFPNHYSIATGLYPGNHGLISNSFYAPDIKDYYSISDRKAVENGKFYKGEPIWVTAEAQRVKTASYFWVGSEAKIKGYYPTYYKLYDHYFPYKNRADSIIQWLSLPYSERPHLITWYLDKTDGVGHSFGPNSPEINGAIQNLDSIIGYFRAQLSQLPIKDSVNFIIVSDHGMSALDSLKTVYLSDYLSTTWIDTIMGSNPFYLVYPEDECSDSILLALKNVKGVKSWKKHDLPDRFHLKQSDRISEVIAIADSGWSVAINHKQMAYTSGTHGYDNEFKDMYGIFYAIGPDFKVGYNAGTLYNVDIYNLIAEILKIKPAPNDGQADRINHILKKQ